MLNISINTDELRRKITATRPAIELDIARAVGVAVKAATAKAKQGNFKDQTGRLRSSIFDQITGWTLDTYWAKFVSPTEYSIFLEEGTEEHDIWPKAPYDFTGATRKGQSRRASGDGPHEHIVGRGIALRWKDANGNSVFARKVHHPGTSPTHFMSNAAEVARSTLQNELNGGFANVRSVWIN